MQMWHVLAGSSDRPIEKYISFRFNSMYSLYLMWADDTPIGVRMSMIRIK